MAANYATALKTARMNEVLDAIAGGTLEILTAADAVLAVFTLASPAGTVTTDTLTFDFPVSDTAADGTGTAAKAQVKNSGGTVQISGLTVGTSGSNINLDSVSITTGQTVTLSSGTITHAA